LKSAEVRFNPARWWCVPLQLARIEGPSGASCNFGPARHTVRRRFIGTDSHRWKPEMPGLNVHPCQSNISAQVSVLRPGNLRRQRTPGSPGCLPSLWPDRSRDDRGFAASCSTVDPRAVDGRSSTNPHRAGVPVSATRAGNARSIRPAQRPTLEARPPSNRSQINCAATPFHDL